MSEIWLGGIRLRNRLVTSSSLLGYGMPGSGLVPYGMSPISRFVPLERFGAVTTRTLTVAPRDGHFTNRTDWPLQALPGLLRRYATVLRRADAGWINAVGWCNVGIEAYLRDYYPRTRDQNTIISVGGFAAEEFVTLTDAVPRSRHPVILTLSPDRDYVRHARRAAAAGFSALIAIISLGSASWLSPLWAWQLRSLLHRIEAVSGKQCYSSQRHSQAAQPHG